MAGVKNVLLSNHLRHVGTHNKVQEEREMWRLRKLETNTSLHTFDISHKSRAPLTRGRLLSDNYQTTETSDRVGGVRDEEDESRLSNKEPSLKRKKSYHWTRQLMKAEETDSHRWGHAGYKELHPEEFVSTSEEEKREENGHDRHGKRKRKSKKAKTKSKLKKRKHLDNEEWDSDTTSDSSTIIRKRRKQLKEKKEKKKKKAARK